MFEISTLWNDMWFVYVYIKETEVENFISVLHKINHNVWYPEKFKIHAHMNAMTFLYALVPYA